MTSKRRGRGQLGSCYRIRDWCGGYGVSHSWLLLLCANPNLRQALIFRRLRNVPRGGWPWPEPRLLLTSNLPSCWKEVRPVTKRGYRLMLNSCKFINHLRLEKSKVSSKERKSSSGGKILGISWPPNKSLAVFPTFRFYDETEDIFVTFWRFNFHRKSNLNTVGNTDSLKMSLEDKSCFDWLMISLVAIYQTYLFSSVLPTLSISFKPFTKHVKWMFTFMALYVP